VSLAEQVSTEIPVNPCTVPCCGAEICWFGQKLQNSPLAAKKFAAKFPAAGNLPTLRTVRYPFTFTVAKARTTWPLAGSPKARAGSNVVKIRALSIFTRSASES